MEARDLLKKYAERTLRVMNSGSWNQDFANRMMERLRGYEDALVQLGVIASEEAEIIIDGIFGEDNCI